MKKKEFKLLVIPLIMALTLSVFPNVSHAETEEQLNGWLTDNYWSELEIYNGNLIPKGVNLEEISFLGKNIHVDDNFGFMWANTGIRSDRPALFDLFGEDAGYDLKDIADRDYSSWNDEYHKDGKVWNPLNFDTEKDLIKNINDFNIYGDLSSPQTTNSKTVGEYTIGDILNLDLSVDLSLFKNVMNTHLLEVINSKYDYTATKLPLEGQGFVLADDKFAFTFDFPAGIVIDDSMQLEIKGLEGYPLKWDTIKDDTTGKKIVVYADEENPRAVSSVADYFNKMNASNGRVTLSIKNVKISDSVPLNTNLTIKSFIGGMYDFAMTNNKAILDNRSSEGIDIDKDYLTRTFTVFAAKQNNEGRDEAAPADKPNLISYTFKVNKPANNTVTFINEDAEYAKVKVETGKAIDNDGLTSESMPQNPTKSGYTFKEWNTQNDGKGTAFTGTTVVDEDMTVYAIYSKNAVVINEAPTLEVKDKTIKQGEELDLMSLVVFAKDKEDGDLESTVELIDDGGFDKDKVGKYTITYKVTDKDGASITKKATVTVIEKDKPTPNTDNNKPQAPNSKMSPKTGDSFNLALYGILIGLSGLLLIAAEARKSRK